MAPIYWAATTQDRDQALSVDERERFEHAWMFPNYSIDRDIDLSSRQDGDEALVAALWRIAAIDDPGEWILQDVCRNISHAPPANARTSDFVCFLADPGIGEDLARTIRYAAPPEVAKTLARQAILDP